MGFRPVPEPPSVSFILRQRESLLQFSLDGPTAGVNDRIRGEGVFARVMAALDLFRGSRVKLYLAMLPVPGLSLEALAIQGPGFTKELKARFGEQLTVSISQGILPSRKVSREDGLGFIYKCRELQNILTDPLTTAGLDLWQWEPGRKNWPSGYGRQLSVEPDGAVKVCTAGGVVGNVRETSLSQIVQKLRLIADDHHVEFVESCRGYALRFLCGGPCRIQPEPCTEELRQDLLRRIVKSNPLRYQIDVED